MACDCKHLRPIYWINPETNNTEVEALVCQNCLREFPVPPHLTRIEYERLVKICENKFCFSKL
jgi:hypothetical protein